MADIPQLRQRLDEQVLERAETDSQWKRQYIEDPKTAVSDMPEAQRLREIDENASGLPGNRRTPLWSLLQKNTSSCGRA